MNEIYKEKEFEAVKLRFENQTEQLYRMTMIDLRIFSGFITLQLALGAWLAKNPEAFSWKVKPGLFVIDFGLVCVAAALLRNNALRRKEVAAVVGNCAKALGYKTPGAFLEADPLDVKMEMRLWKNYYYWGIAISLIGVFLVLVCAS